MNDRASKEKIVISLGGSIIIPDSIDTTFLAEFRSLILSHVDQGKEFFIITGGGSVCREYQRALQDLSDSEDDVLDWMGIYSTHLNARFVRLVFGEHADECVVTEEKFLDSVSKPITLIGGWVPGHSSDFGAVEVAHKVGADTVLNLSNISHVYSADPKKDPHAEKLNELKWSEYMEIIPEEWNPGLNTPFDPIAAGKAKEYGLKVVIMDGTDVSNISRYLNAEGFEGTLLS